MSTPNPGSDEAVAAGCTCPVMDNNRGKRPPFPPVPESGASPSRSAGWWVSYDCPVHNPPGVKQMHR